jgi:hypothetical protein
VGYNSKVAVAAHALPIGKISPVIEQDKSYYLVKPLWKDTIDSIPWDSNEITLTRERLKSQMTHRAYFDWYTAYKNDVKITSNVNDIYLD